MLADHPIFVELCYWKNTFANAVRLSFKMVAFKGSQYCAFICCQTSIDKRISVPFNNEIIRIIGEEKAGCSASSETIAGHDNVQTGVVLDIPLLVCIFLPVTLSMLLKAGGI